MNFGVKTVMAADEFCDSIGRGAGSANPAVNTALGCIPVRANEFVIWLMPYLFGIAGGIAFLLMISGFIKMAMSKGDPKMVEAARESINAALTGLIVSILALFLLRLIAVDILHIPGLSR